MKLSLALCCALAVAVESAHVLRHLRGLDPEEQQQDAPASQGDGGWADLAPKAQDGGWQDMSQDMACFVDVQRFGINATADNVVFRAGHGTKSGMPEVLVMQEAMGVADNVQRTLIFKSSDGKCNPQAGALCKHIDGSAAPATSKSTLAMSSLGSNLGSMEQDSDALGMGSDSDLCDTMICNADIRKNIMETGSSYVRSMASTMLLLAQRSGEGDACTPASPKNIVNIGFGSGSFGMLLHEFFPDAHQTVVELSAQVVQAAKCFGVSGTEFDLQNADGRAYLEAAADGSLDAIFIDAFDGNDNVPKCLATTEFLATVRRKLRDGGVFAMNAHSGTTLRSDLKDLLPVAHATFKSVMLGKAPGLGNVIIAAVAGDAPSCNVDGIATNGNSNMEDLKAWWSDAAFEVDAPTQAGVQPLTDAAAGCQR